ncbi:MAG: cytochrome P450 [Sphingomicrobium sp.]
MSQGSAKEVTPFDPFSAEVMRDPFTAYGDARTRCPVMKVSKLDPEFFVVSRYADVKEVMTNHRTWTKSEGSLLRSTERNVALSQDPPDFSEFRRIYATYLSPRSVERLAEPMHRFVTEYLDTMVPLGRGDVHDLFARPLPVKVMATLLGLPQTGLDEYRRLTDFFLASQFNDPDPEVGAAMMRSLYAFFDEQLQERRNLLAQAGIDEPSQEQIGTVLPDDLLSLLLVSKYKDRYLSQEEMRRTARGFFVGNDTFTSLFLNLLRRLLEDRTRWDAVRADPALIDVAIEESLRFDPPALGMFRKSACPVELHGVDIPEGSRMLFAIAGANRDPAVFDDPDEFRLDRDPKQLQRHVAFGFGTHFCPGSAIARLEAKIALSAILERMPELRLTDEPERIAPFNFWGVRSFPASW